MRARWAAAVVGVAAVVLWAADSVAQRFEARRAETILVSTPSGDSPTERGDARRTGFAPAGLPTSGLRPLWRRTLGLEVTSGPLVGRGGEISVVATRGDVVVLSSDGAERHRLSVGTGSPGPATLLSDGTLVFVAGDGQAVGVRDGVLRFRTPIGDRTVREKAAPLALDDGGVVVTLGAELAALDAEGAVRHRATLPEPAVWPLVPGLGKVAAVGASGTVYLWSPGREPTRAGTFGGALSGGAVAADGKTLLGVVEGTHLAALDLEHGITATRALSSGGLLVGPPSFSPVGGTTYALSVTPSAVFAVAVGPSGQELLHVSVELSTATMAGDGGGPSFALPAHLESLVDTAGTFAFGTPEASVGVVTAAGAVELLGESLCAVSGRARWAPAPGTGHPPTGIAGFAAAGPGAFLVLCEAGVVAKVGSNRDAAE